MNCVQVLAFGIGLLAAFPALAVPTAEVMGLQMPAWLGRDGHQRPLEAGMVLTQGEEIHTGIAARVLARFPGGELILGELARITLAQMRPARSGGTYRTMLIVRRGAFRIANVPDKDSVRYDISVHLGTVKVHILSGDVWGRVGMQSAVICLVQGHIAVREPVAGKLDMEKPMTLLRVGQTPHPLRVRSENPQRFKSWSAQTKIIPGEGLTVPGGTWFVQLAAEKRQRSLYPMQHRLATAGYPVKMTKTRVKGRTFYRLRIGGFGSKPDGQIFAGRMREHYGVAVPWVVRGHGRPN